MICRIPRLTQAMERTAFAFQANVYEVRPRKDHRGIDLISDALPFGRLVVWRTNAASKAIGYAQQYSPSHDAVIRVYDDSSNVAETHEHAGEFKEPHGGSASPTSPGSNAPTT